MRSSTIQGLLDDISEYKKKYGITEKSSDAEKLRYELSHGHNMTNEEMLDLRDRVREFLKSDASEDDKNIVRGYTESLSIICSAITEDAK